MLYMNDSSPIDWQAVRRALDAHGMPFFYFNPCNVIAYMHTKGACVEKLEHAYLFSVPGQDACLIPWSVDRRGFYRDMLGALSVCGTLKHLPEHYLAQLKKQHSVRIGQKEHMIETQMLRTLQSPRLKGRRNEISKIKRKSGYEIVTLSADTVEAFLACNADWYRWQTVRSDKFRLSGKREIEYLLSSLLSDLPAPSSCIGVMRNGTVYGFAIGSQLSEKYRVCQTRRIRDDADVGTSYYVWHLLADAFAHIPFENDGTSDTRGIRASKMPFTYGLTCTYTVSR